MAYTTIDDPELYFQAVEYSGNNTSQSITLDGSEDMQPDMVWIKERNGTEQHTLWDSVRGVNKRLMPDATSAEYEASDQLTAFNSDGFSVGSSDQLNDSGNTQVAWCWKESATAGFDIVSYTGDGSNRTISHSLSAVPHLMIFKNRENTATAYDWAVYHQNLDSSAPEDKNLRLNTAEAVNDKAEFLNDTAPTSSVFSAGTWGSINDNNDDYIAYLWTAKQGYSKFGGYTGNGNADGPFVYLGFRPAWLMIKNITSGSTYWTICDNKRDGFNDNNHRLFPNVSDAESTSNPWEMYSNGFKITTTGSYVNTNGDSYIYASFAEQPFVNSNGVPATAR